MTLATIAAEAPHPLLGGEEGGVVDQLRVVHDVFGHAALGVGFDREKPALRGDLPPARLVAACDADGWSRRRRSR